MGSTTVLSGRPSEFSSPKDAPAGFLSSAASANMVLFRRAWSPLPSTVHATRPSTIPAMTSLLRGSISSAAS